VLPGLPIGRFARWVVVLDALLILAAVTASAALAWRVTHASLLPDLLRDWKGATLVVLAVHLLVFYVFELYSAELDFRRGRNLLRVLGAVAVASAMVASLSFIVPRWSFHRSLFVLHALSLGALISLSRAWVWTALAGRAPPDASVHIDLRGTPAEVLRALRDHPERRFRLARDVGSAVPPAEWAAVVKQCDARHVLVSGIDALTPEGTAALLALKRDGVEVHDTADVYQQVVGRIPVEMVDDLYFLRRPAFTTAAHGAWLNLLRVLDVLGALVLLILSLPLWILAVAGITLTMPGPVLFSQQRVGEQGRPFTIYKFRSMGLDAERDGPQWSRPGDDRVTPWGRFMRRTRIDELPQLWNVLRGDMSLVGPRPERPEFVARLVEQLPYYALRFQVKPGLTGWAQVSFRYGSSVDDTRVKLSYDLYYVQERSLLLYAVILLKTVATVLFKPGS
jgi:exopolysaccharide biosynthesis polyprenyl glycosylphosphotransferase